MNTSVVTTREELFEFQAAAALGTGDPAGAVCLLCVSWDKGPGVDFDLCAMWEQEEKTLLLLMVDEEGIRTLPVPVSTEDVVIEDGRLRAFHVRKISRGTWALAPSLNIPGELHAFVVLHDVPDPAPWESLIILATSF